ncbi:hypothetical protein [Paenibacillus sp. PCH8]|uniref:hypothetical protein n=1 Tax=Paenibacillus sp. PCH8 TaxID=2066524 RepID=UPI0015E40E7D|nr:hypothetical protein [Paenibacillus sp. PCH8]
MLPASKAGVDGISIGEVVWQITPGAPERVTQSMAFNIIRLSTATSSLWFSFSWKQILD